MTTRKRPQLYLIQEPPALKVRNVLPLTPGRRTRKIPAAVAVDAPLPPERCWRDLIRHLTKNPADPKPER